ncbi:F-box domain-containing protein [Favolaschia claudopus]|uniref:F-box domain-containing protein n=1 Tax=Favolaschia claudopus TaxID=2862362 RepID=A0AAW0A0H4_9AGAR
MLVSMESDRVFVAEKDAQILELERQISALQKSISSLRSAKHIPQKRLDAYKYPVLTLPNEIISEIFLHFLPPYPDYPPFIGRLSPFLLTHICHLWREIAIATPKLWRTIAHTQWYPYVNFVPLTALYLERARGCPLSVHRAESHGGFPSLIPYRSRWEHVKLYRVYNWPLMLAGPMPRLRTLHILDVPPVPQPSPIVFTLEHAPLLRILDMPILDAAHLPKLPWGQLTSLTLQTVRLHQLVSILEQSPDLMELRCFIHYCSDFILPPSGIPSLHRLTRLSLDYHTPPKDRNFLNSFTVPALKTLEVPHSLLGKEPIESIKRFMAKSSCQITELRVIRAELPASSYKKEIPSITNIVCERRPRWDWLMIADFLKQFVLASSQENISNEVLD